MRVIAGKYKGRRFEVPKKFSSRPTTDMAREGLFNILGNRSLVEGSEVLDLFFGTGAMSLEFLSRGAKAVTSIDINRESKKHLEKLAEEWEIDHLRVIKADVFRILKNPKGRFDLVFADPPYGEKRLAKIPDLVFRSPWIESGGMLILEHGADHDFSSHPHFDELHRFGNVHFSFFR